MIAVGGRNCVAQADDARGLILAPAFKLLRGYRISTKTFAGCDYSSGAGPQLCCHVVFFTKTYLRMNIKRERERDIDKERKKKEER